MSIGRRLDKDSAGAVNPNQEVAVNHSLFARLIACGALASVALGVNIPAASAQVGTVFATDCASDFVDTYYSNEPVCVTGDLNYVAPGGYFARADIYVAANKTWKAGDRAKDVTGSVNRFQAPSGTFYDVYAWLPNLEPGRYDILVDADLNGRFDPSHDLLLGDGPEEGITVLGQSLAGYSFDSAAIKAEAASQALAWWAVSKSPKLLRKIVDRHAFIGIKQSAAELGKRFSIIESAGLNKVLSVAGDHGLPSSPLAVPVLLGGKVIEDVAGSQAQGFQNLADDPADLAYGVPAALDVSAVNGRLDAELGGGDIAVAYPFETLPAQAAATAEVALARLAAEQTALVEALIHANERYMGAQQANDRRWAVAHATSISVYAGELADNQTEAAAALQTLRDEASGLPGSSEPFDLDMWQDLKERVADDGLTAKEIEALESAGFSAADVALVIEQIEALELPEDGATLLGVYDAAIDATLELEAVFGQAADDAADLAQSLVANFGAVAIPQVSAPDVLGEAGSPLQLSATATGGQGALTVEWDFDLDGEFDDATGAAASLTPSGTSTRLVGVLATDSRGMSGVAYVKVEVTEATGSPEISSVSPAAAQVAVTAGDSQAFSVSATASAGQTLSCQWYVDGELTATTQPSFTLETVSASASLTTVAVVVSDGVTGHAERHARWVVAAAV
ncbi:MAG: PKD domain-containing protein [Bifidobacteriaceae bacterium]|nr:PKD domain-containing protein [Bifidobacteriaceae bacterium]